jgi:hypothetical protein
MRDLASGSGSVPGEQPLPPTVTKRSDADGGPAHGEGPILPPFLPSGARPYSTSPIEIQSASASPADAGGDVSEADYWNELANSGEIAQVSAFAPDGQAENFPMDAFFIPEGADHVPAGVDASAAQHLEHRVELDPKAIAERLEMVARRLRLDGKDALEPMLDGDRLDALLGRVLGEYLASQKP